MGEARLTNPIFFIGVPRSGTTVVFEAFARHQDLGWLSHYSKEYPRLPSLNLLRRVLDNRVVRLFGQKPQHAAVRAMNRYLPRPAEAYPFWEHYCDMPLSRSYLRGARAHPACQARLCEALSAVLRWQGRARFATKLTGPARIEFLHSIFPDSTFVHVIRDGRAVVESLLRVPFWRDGGGLEEPWWRDGLAKSYREQWLSSNKAPSVLAAVQWKNIIEVARQEAGHVGRENYLEVRYEDFMADPHRTLSKLYDACGLPDSSRAHDYVDRNVLLENMNNKYRAGLSPTQVTTISEAMQPLLAALGYTADTAY